MLSKKSKNNSLTSAEEEQLSFFQTRGSIFLLTAAISYCLEIFLDKSITDKFRLEFCGRISLEKAIALWNPLVEIVCSFVTYLKEGFSEGAIREKQAKEAIKKVSKFVLATKGANKATFSEFAKKVKYN